MSSYIHENWFCGPKNEAEAREIVQRAIASGAKLCDNLDNEAGRIFEWDTYPYWGVYDGRTNTGKITWGKHYSLAQLRKKFPLPNEQKEEKPTYTHEYKSSQGVYVWCKVVVNETDTLGKILIKDEYGEYILTHPTNLRPLKSKCDKWVEDVVVFTYKHTTLTPEHIKQAAYAIYKALTSGELKAPEVESCQSNQD